MREPDDAKVSCPVLRGAERGDTLMPTQQSSSSQKQTATGGVHNLRRDHLKAIQLLKSFNLSENSMHGPKVACSYTRYLDRR